MAQGILTVDLSVIAANWRRLDGLTAPACRTGAVIKANAYGTGVDRVAPALALAGTRDFFVASVEEGAALRALLGPGPAIYLLAS